MIIQKKPRTPIILGAFTLLLIIAGVTAVLAAGKTKESRNPPEAASPPGITAQEAASSQAVRDFEDGTLQGWHPRGGGEKLTVTAEAAHESRYGLHVAGRTSGRDGPQLDITPLLKKGELYTLTAWVKLPAGTPEAPVAITVQRTTNGSESSEFITSGTVNDSGWTMLSGRYEALHSFEQLKLTLTSGSNPALEFYADDITVGQKPAAELKAEPQPGPASVQQNIPALKELFAGDFKLGTSLLAEEILNPDGPDAGLLKKHFNSLTPGNELKWDATEPLENSFNFSRADRIADFAADNGIALRGHTLVWHSQTPDWVFHDEQGNLVGKEVLFARMKNHIDTVVGRYKGKIYAWDVVNEVIEPGDNQPGGLRNSLWYQIAGEEYIEKAFEYAHAADPDAKLYINDYNTHIPDKRQYLVELIQRLKAKGVPVEGIGHQNHISLTYPSAAELDSMITAFGDLGIEQQITEMDMSVYSNDSQSYESFSEEMQIAQAHRYREIFDVFMKHREKLTAVIFWGKDDRNTWLRSFPVKRNNWPLLFDEQLQAKYAYWALVDPDKVPGADYGPIHTTHDTQGGTFMNTLNKEENGIIKAIGKEPGKGNPLVSYKFGADPYALVYKDRVYLYMTNDVLEYDDAGQVKDNTYGNINKITVISSDDLLNWTDHGEIAAARSEGAAKWATQSWAPAAAHKVIDGKDKFFLYFANNASGIGVLTSDSPEGPWVDPLGEALILRSVPGVEDVTWLFDPAVLVDDDGRAYIYFGGGVPEGKPEWPNTARVMELGPDMISVVGEAKPIPAPFMFEDAGINKYGGRYYFTYCSNFFSGERPEGSPPAGEIAYMTSDHPMGPWTYRGTILKNPGHFFGVGGNNHHSMFAFHDKWYIAYHAQTLSKELGVPKGYRSTHLNEVLFSDADGTIQEIEANYEGVGAIQSFNPYKSVPAATSAWSAGIAVEPPALSSGEAVNERVVTALTDGSWAAIAGVDFGHPGASEVRVSVAGGDQPSIIELRLDQPDGELIGTVNVAAGSGEKAAELSAKVSGAEGTHDLYLVFRGEGGKQLLQLYRWQFSK
ncbi:endo-1,4-beta-xylanase [Paenibacillus sp. PK3_47]|uniref:endo-1,4-beta-xylanase n=1 Tax=Paenibacillus sp. PK3_47 TaxID=2072642 RepID=UPI00201E5A24|nr:endo-1,4-beta-xylanase [Paenibacillus sp. PK3_47]